MNKVSRKILSLLMAFAFIVTSLGLTKSYAQEEENKTGTITVNNAVDGKTYAIYKILDLTYTGDTESKNVAYTINKDWKDFFTTGKGASYLKDENSGNLNEIQIGGQIKYLDINNNNIANFAKAAMGELSKENKNIANKAVAANKTASFSGLSLGYYLVHPQGASEAKEGQSSIVSLTSTLPDAKIESKGVYPTLTKKVDKKSQDIGKEVTYTLESKVPDTTGYSKYDFVIHDTLSKGLTPIENSLEVKINDTKINNLTFNPVYEAGKATKIEIGLDINNILKNNEGLKAGDPITITYKAKVNKNALIGNDGNENAANLEYSNDPKNTESKEKTPDEKVKVYTGKINVIKHEKNKESKPLQGAVFVLKNNDGKYYKQDDTSKEVTWVDSEEKASKKESDAQGKLDFTGLKAGEYFLKETKAPDGYNKLNKDVNVHLKDGSNEDKTISMEASEKVANSTGLELPTTGGRGTRIFALVGGLVILYAAYSLIKEKRRSLER